MTAPAVDATSSLDGRRPQKARFLMGFYEGWLLPRVMNLLMADKNTTEERKKTLSGVTGAVLEVGFGSGSTYRGIHRAFEDS